LYAAAALGAVIAGAVSAQTVTLKPRGARAAGSATVTVTMQGKDAVATVKSTNSDTRSLFRDIATKSGAKILLGSTVAGTVTSAVDAQPLETAIRTVAASAGLSVRKVLVAPATAAALTEETVAPLAGALITAASDAVVVDPSTGRSVTLTFADTAPKADAAKAVVYYVMRIPPAGRTPQVTGDAAKDAVANAAASLSALSTTERMQAARDLQRQMFESLTPEERDQMRQQGGPGGFGGPPPGGFGGGPGGPPPGDDGGGPPPPPQ
jgi:hypothetical protein